MERSKTKKKHSNMDFSILITVLALCAIGLVMVFSDSYYYAQEKWGDALLYVRKQSIYLALSIPVMLLLTRVDYKVLEKLKTPGLLLSVALLIAVLFFGKEANGAKRWLVIAGQSIQPSEVAKFGMILYMCSFMSSKQHLMKDFVKGLVPMLMVM
ncbi:MAG TPA: FtsW/RodA/SpoVE family cell cycle protein, partial [Clostridia bacterium]|nr:FtsW/RodA/SpoVE family cell cycle protein [Clostridia bacterium]